MKTALKALIVLSLAVIPGNALAQQASSAKVVTTCGGQSYVVGSSQAVTQTAGGAVCTGGGGSGSPTTVTPVPLTPTNDSLAITTGGTAQNALASNAARKACTIQNPSLATDQNIVTAEFLYVRFGGSAAANSDSFGLAPGQSISCDPLGIGVYTTAVSVEGATTGHKVVVVEGN